MLWNSIAEKVVKEMYAEAVARAAVDRKNDTIKRLSYYHDEQEAYIKDALALHYMDPDAFSPAFFNVVKKIVNQLAMIYLADAERAVDGTDRDKEILKEIIQSTSLNPKMKICSRYTQLLKTTMLRPVWRKGRMDLDVMTGDILDVIVGDTPEQLEQVLITHYSQSGEAKDTSYSLWSDDEYRKLDYNGNTLESAVNPYTVIPMVPVWDQYPVGTSFWQAGGDDLINIQTAVNEKLTDLLLVIRQQGFGQAVLKGVPDQGSKMQVGPGTTIEIPDPAGDFFYAKTNAPIQSILNTIDFMVKQLAVSNGLPASSLSVKPTQESGLARISGNRELEELRRDQISLFNTYEKRLFTMFRVVWNYHNPTRQITDTARLKVDFFDPKPTLSPDKEVEKWVKELEIGTISRIDILMIKNPDLSREDAMQKLEEIRIENETFNYSSTGTGNQQGVVSL